MSESLRIFAVILNLIYSYMNSKLAIYAYEGSNVTFSNGDNVMVNATQMAKAFGKRPNDWLRSEQAQRMIEAISASQKCEPTDLVIVKNGGSDYGTWFHEDVALVFAQWLSPDFYVWCNNRIKELIKNGVSDIRETPADRMKELEIEEMKARKGIADSFRELMNIETLSPSWKQILAAKSAEVLSGGEKILPLPKSEVSYAATDIAKELGTSSTMVGRIAKANNLKTKEYGEWYHDKSKYSSKEVDVFRYNQKGFDTIKDIFFNRFR